MDKLIATLRERVLYGGSIGHIYDNEMEQLAAAIPVWRPIAEAPIPGPHEAPDGFTFICLLQTSRMVGEGLARYVTDNRTKGRKSIRVLRWYTGFGAGERVCKDPRYFMPLPQPRKD